MGKRPLSGAEISRLSTTIAIDKKQQHEREVIKAAGRNPACPGKATLSEFYEDMASLFAGKPLTLCSKFTKMNDNAIIVAAITNPHFVAVAVKSTPKDLKNIVPVLKALQSLDETAQKSILRQIQVEFQKDPISLTKINYSCLVRRAALGQEADKKAFVAPEKE